MKVQIGESVQGNKQQNTEITPTKIKERIRKMANWKAPGHDGIHCYWIKMFESMQQKIAVHLQSCMTRGKVPDWMTTSRTVEREDQRKRSQVTNLFTTYVEIAYGYCSR